MDEFQLGSRTLQPRRQLLAGGERVPIGKRALDILSVLAEARGAIVTKDELLDAVWPGVTVEENALQVHVVALRKALGPDADRLETVRGVGYRLAPDSAVPEAAALAADSAAQAVASPEAPKPSAPPRAVEAERRTLGIRSGRPLHLALVVAGVIGLLVAAWAILGGGMPTERDSRVPVVVRALTASGSGDPMEAALASGITDELIVRLRRIPELQVATARTDGSAPSTAFAQAHVVDGNIRSDGEQLRVTVRLTDHQGEILWSETFDRKLADIFDVQEQIASNIANTLSVSLDVGVRSIAYGGTNNPEAYSAYVQGLIHLLDFDQTVTQRHFERAIELDPDFIQAHANLAATYGNRINTAADRAEAERMIAEMGATSDRALKLNPDLWIGSAARGWYELTRKNLGAAERHMRRVVELDEGNDPQLKDNLSQYWLTTGRSRKALAYDSAKTAIDPIHEITGRTTFILMMNGRYPEAIELFDKLAADDMTGLEAFAFHIFWAHLLEGDDAEAMAFARDLNLPFITAAVEEMRDFDELGLETMSLAELRRWAHGTYGETGQYRVGHLGFAAARKGQERLAVDLMRLAFERPGGYALFYLWHPVLAKARKTDAFAELVEDLGFVEVWRQSGDWGDFCRPAGKDEIACQ